MKKLSALGIAVVLFSVSVNAAPISGTVPESGNDAEFYTPGIINPEQGTIEATALPTRPGSEFQNETYAVFAITPGQPIKGNNLMALYTPAGSDGITGFTALVRIGGKTYYANGKNQDFIKTGIPVNVALSWGNAGLLIYLNGKIFAKGNYPKNDMLSPIPALFRLGIDSPFNIQAAKISTVQLPAEKLNADPEKPFVPDTDTSFLLQKGKIGKYFSSNYTGKDFSALMPVWRLESAMSPAGKNGEITLVGLNLSPSPVTYKVKVETVNSDGGDPRSISTDKTLSLSHAFAEQTLQLPVLDTGFYNLNISITDPKGQTAVWKSTYMIYPANEENIKDGKFAGYMGHHLLEKPEALQKIGILWSRAWEGARYFLWYNIEPQKGVFDYTKADNAVENATRHGVNILGLLGNPPLWAAENPQYKNNPHPLSHMCGRWKPRNVEEWGNYVYNVVSRYKGKVKYWEIYNEVDFHPPASTGSFSGTTQDYFELLKAAWNAAKKADPDCKILISGFSTVGSSDVNMPYDLIKMGATKYVDIFSLHSYQALVGVDKLRKACSAVAPDMPFWQTEQGWFMISDMKKRCDMTAAIQFWFIEKQYEKYFNFGSDFANRYTCSPEMVLLTLATVQNNLRKCESFTGTLPDAKIRDFDVKHSFRRTDGNYFTAIGKTDTQTELHLSGDIIRAEDILGRNIPLVRSGEKTILPKGNIVFIVSKTPLKIVDVKMTVATIVSNPGFENVSGDSMGGIKGLIICDWQINKKDGGEILPDNDAHSGKYAVKLSSSAGKRVSISLEARALVPGKYIFSAWLKSAGDKASTATFSMSDLIAKIYVSKKFAAVSAGKYTKYTAEFELKNRPEGVVKFYIGVTDGSILCDDVELFKAPPLNNDVTENIKIENVSRQLNFKADKKEIDLQNMISRIGGKQTIAGATVNVSQLPIVLSGNNGWNGITGKNINLPISGYYSKIAFLVGAMHIQKNGTPVLGTINITFKDGSGAVINLENNKNIRDWYMPAVPGGIAPDITFSDDALKEYGLFLCVWNNPAAQKEIASVNMTAETTGLLCLAAVIVEKNI